MSNEKIKRGMITEEIKKLSKELLGCEINQKELRLMPYIQYVVMNHGYVVRNRVNQEEIQILKRWKKAGFISLLPTAEQIEIEITEAFWNAINQILWLGYASKYELISEGGEE